MPAEDYLTFHDTLIHLQDYERANPSAQRTRFHRRAIFTAMQELSHAHHWSYLYQVGRLNTVAPYDTGTIAYDHTGGTYERLVAITDGSFPAWAHLGILIVNNIRYEVAERISGTYLQLSIASNPQEDLAAGTSYTLIRDRYLLPQDVWTVDQLQTPDAWRILHYVHPREWMRLTRHNTASANTPYYYSVIGSQDFQGCMDCIFEPYPDRATNIDFVYSRKMRIIKVQDVTSEDSEGRTTSTVSTVSSSRTVTGDGTNFTDDLVGSLLRVVDDAVELPTGLDGANPYTEQRMIMSVESTTSLTVDFDFATTRSDVKYVVSDPIDIEYGVMKTAFLRCCENQLAKMARMTDRQAVEAEYQYALRIAKEADSRSTQPRSVGSQPAFYQRTADMPLGADIA
jgi:hypothetical protein